jgi:hypothetical protein
MIRTQKRHTLDTPVVKAAKLARDIAKSHGHLRIRRGTTNGEPVLHVREPGRTSFTIRNAGEWEECPLNIDRIRRDRKIAGADNKSAKREQEIDALTGMIANKDAR